MGMDAVDTDSRRGAMPGPESESTMTTTTKDVATWPARPFDPTCTERVPKDPEVIAAVRLVVADWDGENLGTVEQALRNAGRMLGEIRRMSWAGIRQAFDTGPAAMRLILAGHENKAVCTASHSIVALGEYAAGGILRESELSQSQKPTPEDDGELTTVSEMARISHRSESWWRDQVGDGKPIPCIGTSGRAKVFCRSDALRLMKERCIPGK